MLYTRHNFEIARFCAANSARPGLQAVLVAADKTVATDTFTLVEVFAPSEAGDEKDFPKTPGHQYQVEAPHEAFLLPKGVALQVARNIPRRAALPVLERAAVIKSPEGTVGLVTTDLERARPLTVRKVEGSFPIYAHLFPKKKAYRVLHVNAEYLKNLAAFFSQFTSGPNHTLTLKLYGPTDPVLFEAANGVQKARALLMPQRKK